MIKSTEDMLNILKKGIFFIAEIGKHQMKKQSMNI